MEYTKEELQQHLGDLAMRLAKVQELYKKQQEIIGKFIPLVNSVVYVLKEDYDESSYILGIYCDYEEALKHLQKVQETNNDDNANQYLIRWNTDTQKHLVVNGSDGDVY
jgi:tetratricopeptide (TPR) repeat protein